MKALFTVIALFCGFSAVSVPVRGQEKAKRTEQDIREELKQAKKKVADLENEL